MKKSGMSWVLFVLCCFVLSACASRQVVVEGPGKEEPKIAEKPGSGAGQAEKSLEKKPSPSKAEKFGKKAQKALEANDTATAAYYFNRALSLADDKEKQALMAPIKNFLARADNLLLEDLLASEKNLIPVSLILYRLGLNHAADGDYDKAEKILERFVANFPDHENAGDAAEVVKLVRELGFKGNRVGCLLPLSGKFSTFGQMALKGIELAVMEFSKAYSQEIRVVVKDTRSDNARAVEMMNELVNENVAAVVGPMATAGAVAAVAEKNRIPIIAMTQKEDVALSGEYVFSNFITPQMQARALVSYAFQNLGVSKFAVLYPEDRYGRTYMNLFWDMVEEVGGTIVGAESYSHDQTDFSDAIKKLTGTYYPVPSFLAEQHEALLASMKEGEEHLEREEAEPFDTGRDQSGKKSDKKRKRGDDEENEEQAIVDFKALFIPDEPSKVSMILPQLAYHDATGIYLLGTNIWHSSRLLKDAAGYVTNSVITEGYFSRSEKKKAADFAGAFQALYNEDPGFVEACAYDTITMLVTTAMDDLVESRQALKEGLKSRMFDGVTGTTLFDSNGNAQSEPFFLTVKRGRFVEIDH
ncbi:MAG: penicillin-binding protein activator [Desulfobacteraceae bacterium]